MAKSEDNKINVNEEKRKRIAKLEREIYRIQQSSRTTWPLFIKLHDILRLRFPWYYRWHTFSYASFVHYFILILLCISFGGYFFISQPVIAATVTWDGEGTDGTCGGGAGDGNKWSCALNWTGDAVPTSADAAVFNGTSTKDATIDPGFAGVITSISINSGYTGTITQTRSLQTSSTFTQAAGIYSASNQTLDIDGAMSLTAGTFTASSSSTSLAGALTISGSPTFNANSGTFSFDGATTATMSCNSVTFNLVTISHTSGTKTFNSNCTLPLGASPTISNTVTLNGTLTGTGTLTTTTGTFTNNAGSSFTGFSGLVTGGGFLVAGATVNLGSYSPVDFNSTLSITSGNFTAPSGIMTLASALTISGSPTFDANGGTFTIDGTATASMSCNNVTFNSVTFAHTAGTKTVNSNCQMPLGAGPTLPNPVTLAGTLSGTGTLNTTSTATLTLNANASLSGFNGLVAGTSVIVSGATVDFGSYSPVDINGGITLSSGSLTAPTGTMTVAGSLTISGSPTFDANGGTVTFDGSTATLSCNNVTFNHVIFNNSATKTVNNNCSLPLGSSPILPSTVTLLGALTGSGTLTNTGTFNLNTGGTLSGFTGLVANGPISFGGAVIDLSSYSTVDINGTFALSAGTLTAPTGAMTIASSFTVSGSPTFNANSGTVTFDGTTATLSCNNITFNLVTFNITGIKTVSSNCSLPLGNDPTINSGITLNGTLSGTGTLNIPGSTFLLNSTAAVSGFSGLIAANLTLTGPTINFGSYSSVDVNNNFTFSSGTFTAPSATMTVAGGFALSGSAVFNANGGTLTFDGGTANIDCNNAVFNRVVFNNTGTKTLIASNDCSLPLGNNPTIAHGITMNAGTLSGSGTLTTAAGNATLFNGTIFSGFTGLVANGTITDAGMVMDLSNYTTVDINNSLVINTSGVFTAPTGTMTLAGGYSRTVSSTFNHNNGTVIVDGVGTFDPSTSDTFNNLTFAPPVIMQTAFAANDSVTVIGTLTLTEGIINQTTIPAAGTIVAQGNIVQGSGFDGGTGTVVVNSSGDQTLTGNATESTGELLNITVNKSSGTLFLAGTIRTAYPWNYSAGTVDATTNNSTIVFAGDQTIGGAYTLDNIILDGDTRTKTLGGNLDVDGNLTIAGTLDASSSNFNINVGGNWSLNSEFIPHTGTVIFDGTNQTISGSTSFYNLTKKVTAAATLTFGANTTQTVTNTLDLGGVSGQLLSLRSSLDGSQWNINPQGTRTIAYLDVKDSNNSNSTDIDARGTGSVDSGNNVRWIFDAIASSDSSSNGDTSSSPTASPTTTPKEASTLDTEIIEQKETVIDNPTDEQKSQQNVLIIKVVDRKLKPLSDVNVTLYSEPRTMKTNNEGIVRFTTVEPGLHRVVVNYRGQIGEELVNLRSNVSEETVTQFDLTIQLKPSNPLLTPVAITVFSIMGLIILFLIAFLIFWKGKKDPDQKPATKKSATEDADWQDDKNSQKDNKKSRNKLDL